jgi:hypothetical protein
VTGVTTTLDPLPALYLSPALEVAAHEAGTWTVRSKATGASAPAATGAAPTRILVARYALLGHLVSHRPHGQDEGAHLAAALGDHIVLDRSEALRAAATLYHRWGWYDSPEIAYRSLDRLIPGPDGRPDMDPGTAAQLLHLGASC